MRPCGYFLAGRLSGMVHQVPLFRRDGNAGKQASHADSQEAAGRTGKRWLESGLSGFLRCESTHARL